MHVTQLLKKETEAETPEGGRGGGIGGEASHSVSVLRASPSWERRSRSRSGSRDWEAEPGWAVRCSSFSTLGRDQGGKKGLLRPPSYSGLPLLYTSAPTWVGKRSTILIPVVTPQFTSLN